jgi:hypothetical protein
MAVKQLSVDELGITQKRFTLRGFSSPLLFAPSLWLDASDTLTITASSGSVSQWNDKSGNGRNVVQANSANQPVTGTRTQNGLNAIDFNGTTNRLDNASTSLVNQSNGTFTTFAVVVPDVVTGTRGILNGDPQVGTRPPQFLRFNTTTLECIRVTNFAGSLSVVTATRTSATTATTPTLVRSTLTASSMVVTANGVEGAAPLTTGGSSAVSALVTVGSVANSAFFDGMICEILAFPSVLSGSAVDVVQEYLRVKWAVY